MTLDRLLSHAGTAVLLTTLATAASAAPEPRLELSAPRNFGYVMGDTVEHDIRVTVPAGHALETGFLPRPGTLGEWLTVRAVTWDETRADGETRYRIRVAYQIYKGVRDTEQATIPPLPLRFSGPEPLEIRTPEWAFTMVPLIPPKTPDEAVVLRAARPPEPLETEPHRQRLLVGFGGLVLGLGLLAWRRMGGPIRNRPFARARRELRRLARGTLTPETGRAAARLFHRALDQTAGQAVFAGQLDGFVAARPAYAGLRDDLARFFEFSHRLFFTDAEPDWPSGWLEDLCRRCAAAERKSA
jgi:mxaA protein